LSEAKIKEGIFVGPQIRELAKDKNFDSILNEVELTTWTAFKDISKNFLGNNKANNYQEIVEKVLQSYEAMGCNMPLKFTSYTHIWISSHKISVQLVMNMDSVFTRTLLLRKNGTKGSGVLTRCQITAGDVPETNCKRKSSAKNVKIST
jgi:hypothetical protein